MRTPTISLALLTVALLACSSDAARGPLAPSLSRGAPLPFHGTLETSHVPTFDPVTNTVRIHVVGTGTATYLGRFTLVSDVVLDAATGTGPERTTLTAANGDRLTATGTGQAIPSGDGVTVNTLESMTITGGTGRLSGATGSFVLRQVDVAPTHSSSASFTGTISLGP